MKQKTSEVFDKEETERRMQAALRGAQIAGHKTMKDIPKKDGESRQSKRQRKSRGA